MHIDRAPGSSDEDQPVIILSQKVTLLGSRMKQIRRLSDIALDPVSARQLHGQGKLGIAIAALGPSRIPLRRCGQVLAHTKTSRMNSANERKGLYFAFF